MKEKESAVTPEIAKKEVLGWLDHKRTPEAKRVQYAGTIKHLEELVQEGVLTIADDKSIVHNLIFPIKVAGVDVNEISYKARLNVKDVKDATTIVRTGDNDSRLLAHIEASANQDIKVIDKMDLEDLKIAQTIALFFIA